MIEDRLNDLIATGYFDEHQFEEYECLILTSSPRSPYP
jgi:hypothetical protein